MKKDCMVQIFPGVKNIFSFFELEFQYKGEKLTHAKIRF